MRYRIGAHDCNAVHDIFFARDNYATLFVNGIDKDNHRLWKQHSTVKDISLHYGDVVGLWVVDEGGWYGGIIAIVQKGSLVKYFTGSSSQDWRAARSFEIVGNPNAWALPEYNACDWDKPGPTPRNGRIGYGYADNFPYNETGASYVWAKNAQRDRTTLFVRLRIGGGC